MADPTPAPNQGDRGAGAEREGERLQKVLARVGVGSRRTCEDLIADGRVTVDGAVAVLGRRVDPDTALVEVDGAPTVVGLVPDEPRVFPVGRLDVDTEGLLLLTNDGELTHRLTHPSYGVEKEYVAEVRGTPTRAVLRQLREGIELDDGPTAPARAALLDDSVVRLTIHEGRNRQVRRMCDAVGHPVVRLVRTRIGPIADRSLAPGAWRALTVDEIRALEVVVASDSGTLPKA